MATNTSEQNTPVDHQPINMVEFVAFVPHEVPSESRNNDNTEPVDDNDSQFDYPDATSLNFDNLNLNTIVNIDNSTFTNEEVLEIYQRLIQRFLTAQANLQRLTEETALSIKELQHEIYAAKRGLEYREVMLGRNSHGWRARLRMVVKSSRPKELRQGIESFKGVIASMERIERLVADNEAARLPGMTEEVEMSLERVRAYDAYLEVRGIEVPGDAADAHSS